MGGDELAEEALVGAEGGKGEAGDGVAVEPAGDGSAGVGRKGPASRQRLGAVLTHHAAGLRGELGGEIGGDGAVAVGAVGQRGPIADVRDEKPDD